MCSHLNCQLCPDFKDTANLTFSCVQNLALERETKWWWGRMLIGRFHPTKMLKFCLYCPVDLLKSRNPFLVKWNNFKTWFLCFFSSITPVYWFDGDVNPRYRLRLAKPPARRDQREGVWRHPWCHQKPCTMSAAGSQRTPRLMVLFCDVTLSLYDREMNCWTDNLQRKERFNTENKKRSIVDSAWRG